MAHFYSEIQGNRGMTSRIGTKNSGIWGHIRGWNTGVEVSGYVDKEGRDVFKVYATGGSSGYFTSKLVAVITVDDYGNTIFETTKEEE